MVSLTCDWHILCAVFLLVISIKQAQWYFSLRWNDLCCSEISVHQLSSWCSSKNIYFGHFIAGYRILTCHLCYFVFLKLFSLPKNILKSEFIIWMNEYQWNTLLSHGLECVSISQSMILTLIHPICLVIWTPLRYEHSCIN